MSSGPVETPPYQPFGAAYELERELGRGGMATVYLAYDRKHDRRVAIKVLHAELAAVLGTERFLNEIRVTANLQHPHILGLIDSGVLAREAGELAGRPYYVMPYVRGESLRQRLEREAQLSVADAVRLATEVASALDYAHRQGVVHRDVKPENILLHDGSALVADFGIALAVQQAGGTRLTQTGLSLGTPQYMSPEQAMGERTITPRSDVYALGAVTYEMLAGEPPFTGPSVQAIIARLMTEAPRRLTVQRRSVPAHVEAAVLRALEKLPADRFASAAEFAAALAGPAPAAVPATRPWVPATRARWTAWLPWALATAAIGYLLFDTLASRSTPRSQPGVQRFSVVLPAHAAWEEDVNSLLALADDGSVLAYNGLDSTRQRRLYMRAADRVDPIPVPGSETAHFPAFSADGRWLGFVLNSRIMRVRVGGGTPELVCDIGGLSHWTWLETDVVLFADGTGVKQCTMTGQVTLVVAADSTRSFEYPHALPGGHAIVLTIRTHNERRLGVLDLRTRTVTTLGVVGSDARYVATGHLVYASDDGVIRAVPFDVDAPALRGDPLVVASGVRVDAQGRAFMALARDGTMVTVPATAFQRHIELVDRHGRGQPLYPGRGEFSDPRSSPDGRWIALSVRDDIWRLDRAQGTLTRLTSDGGAERPAWHPDGRSVAYVQRIGPRNSLRVINSDGSGSPRTLVRIPGLEPWHVVFTPDSHSVLVRTVGNLGKRDVLLVPLDSARSPVPLLATPADEVSPSLSPDGRWLAYASNESGRFEIYVRSFPDMRNRQQVSLDGGSEPVWSPRGGELFYRNGSTMLAAVVRADPVFEVVRRTPLFSNGDFAVGTTYQNYDLAPDGTHFVMVRNTGGPSALTVTLHQFEHLGRSDAGARR